MEGGLITCVEYRGILNILHSLVLVIKVSVYFGQSRYYSVPLP
jgi:hypothetical protein